MNLVRICDIDGNLLYEGRAKSRKAFIGELVKAQKSLARADLEGADLTHLDLDGCILDGANLNGCDLRGTRAKRGSFIGAKFRGIVGMGFMAKHAVFRAAEFGTYEHPRLGLIPSRLDGAILQNSNFDEAICENTNFTWTGMSNTSFVGATLKDCNFYKAHLHNVEWGRATTERCSFDEADMTPTFDKLKREHLPDRTIDTRALGNSYKGTKLGKGNSAFLKDSIWGKTLKFGAGAAATLSLTAAGAYIPMDIDFSSVKNIVGNASWSFIGVASALVLMKDRIEDFFKDGFSHIASNTTIRVRTAIQEMAGRGVAVKNISVAVTTGNGGQALREALKGDKSTFSSIAANLAGTVDVIIAKRKNLAAALHRISDTISGNKPKHQDVILTRLGAGTPDARIPATMIFRRNGNVEAVWNLGEGQTRREAWDIAGVPLVENGDILPQGPHNEHTLILKRFADTILLETNVLSFDFDPHSHQIFQGLDGSIVVTDRHTGKLDNIWGPATVTPDDECYYFRQGSVRDSNLRVIKENPPEIAPSP